MGQAIYISTDVNEVRKIIAREDFRRTQKNYHFTPWVSLNGTQTITNIPIDLGKIIQEKNKIKFNPMSAIYGERGGEETYSLIKKLVEEGLFVASYINGKTEHYFLNKHQNVKGYY